VDTVRRDFVTTKHYPGRQPTDAAIRSVYEDWGGWKYLAYWYDIWTGADE